MRNATRMDDGAAWIASSMGSLVRGLKRAKIAI
jgi:hypothetical protein